VKISVDTNVLLRAVVQDDAAQALGGDTFVSFDKKAVSLLTAQGQAASLL
jgi:predicted nucleic-acid-binding protein